MIGIGLRPKFVTGKRVNPLYEELTDGATTIRLGIVDGDLKLYYPATDEVIREWVKYI